VNDRALNFVRDLVGAFNERDIEPLLGYFAADVEFHTPLAEYRGHEGLRAWQRDFDEAFGAEIRGEPGAFLERGDATLFSYVLRGRGIHSEIELSMENTAIVRWRDGLIVEMTVYRFLEEALARLGASPDELRRLSV
jgi:ketosteroid isomerase-like protein